MKIRNMDMIIKASIPWQKLNITFFVLFVTLSTVFVQMLVGLIFPLGSTMENKINNHVYNRELTLMYSDTATQERIENDITEIKKIENVVDVYYQPNVIQRVVTSNGLQGEYALNFIHNGYIPKITLGRNIEENETNVGLLPETIKCYDESSGMMCEIKGEDYLGKTLELDYSCDEPYKVKIVGVYDLSDPIFTGNEILIPREDLAQCKYNQNTIREKVSDESYYIVLIDNYKNVQDAQKEISQIKYAYQIQSLPIDTDSYNTAFIVLILLFILLIILVISGLFMILQSNIRKQTNELALYRSLGYKSLDLFKILFLEYLVFGVLSIALGIVIAWILNLFIVTPYIVKLVGGTIMEMTPNITFASIVCFVAFFIIILSTVCRFAVKRSEKIDLTILLREK